MKIWKYHIFLLRCLICELKVLAIRSEKEMQSDAAYLCTDCFKRRNS